MGKHSEVSLVLGNCIFEMERIKKESIDLTITSPPYDNLRIYDDIVWNESIWKDILKGLFRITKNGGVVVWIVSDKTKDFSESGTSFKQALYAKEIGFCLYDTMIYKKTTFPINSNRYNQVFEYMFIFSKGKVKTFNPLMEKCKNNGRINKGGTQRLQDGSTRKCKAYITKEMKKKNNIWSYKAGFGKTTKDFYAYDHPAMFPEELARDHILSWSNSGDIVFDPMMGAGTVGKMAMLLDRDFIGIEISEKYFEIAKKRIKLNQTLFNTPNINFEVNSENNRK